MTTEVTSWRCGEAEEDTDHILRYCKFAKEVWQHLMSAPRFALFSHGELGVWMLRNLIRASVLLTGGVSWAHLFGFTCWKLWEARNKGFFRICRFKQVH
ncbi:hypothetical protein K1719_028818 [Acacia pycnantha]|nr:hypothetical protein K1719_028818 [Acacia pycnantha]